MTEKKYTDKLKEEDFEGIEMSAFSINFRKDGVNIFIIGQLVRQSWIISKNVQ